MPQKISPKPKKIRPEAPAKPGEKSPAETTTQAPQATPAVMHEQHKAEAGKEGGKEGPGV